MAVPNSGALKLWQAIWNDEIGGSKGLNSLHSASIYAGFSTPDAMSDFYGWADVELATVVTNAMSSVGHDSMTLNGNLTNTGNDDCAVGFYFGTSTNRTSNSQYSSGTKTGTGTFTNNRTGLSNGTNYYSWAYATNDAGTASGARQDATTTYPPFTPQVIVYDTACAFFEVNPQGEATGCCWRQGYFNPYSSTLVDMNSGTTCFCFNSTNFGGTIYFNAANNAKTYFQACANADITQVIHYSDQAAWKGTGCDFSSYNVTLVGNVPSNKYGCYLATHFFCIEAFSVYSGDAIGQRVEYCYTCNPSDIRFKGDITYL
jgi:hypothetical protein